MDILERLEQLTDEDLNNLRSVPLVECTARVYSTGHDGAFVLEIDGKEALRLSPAESVAAMIGMPRLLSETIGTLLLSGMNADLMRKSGVKPSV